MSRIAMFSGGVGSWAAAKRANADQLLFADTLIEDDDLYRFLDEAAANIGAPLTRIAEGRTPWEVFRDKRLIGNSMKDPCSEILKRKLMRKWLEANCDPAETVCILGIDWTESHRMRGAEKRWAPWKVEAPLCNPPYIYKLELIDWLKAEGIEPPRLYRMGFPHNNCGGFCVKAGAGEFIRLLQAMPERYAEHEAQEEAWRQDIGKDNAILRYRSGPLTGQPMTMRALRERYQAGLPCEDLFGESSGCGCAVDA